jgi:hypothetical protein
MEESRIPQDASEWEGKNNMIPLLFAGAVLMLGLAASKAKAQPETVTPVVPTPTVPKTTVSVKTPTPKRRVARAKAVKRIEKAKTIKRVTAIAKSARARDALSKLIKIAKSPAVPATVRQAAQAKVDKIVAKPATVRAANVKQLPQPAKIAIASAVAKADKVKPTPDQAAKILYIWTKGGGNQGTKNNRSATVKNCQELMGFSGSDADGIIGPKTRKRAKELGYTLAPRSAQKPGAVGYASLLGYQ